MMLLGDMRRFKITADSTSKLRIPAFGGSMIRGALGHALRHAECRCKDSTSSHHPTCLYASLFESGAGHAFVITPPPKGLVVDGEPFTCLVTLLKNDQTHAQALINALELGFRRGLGPRMVPCHISEIQELSPEVVPLDQTARLELLTPWSIKYRGKSLYASELTIHSFLIAIAQRQRILVREGLLDAEIPNNNNLLAQADTLQATLQVRDVSGERRSNRQHSKHSLHGIKGSIEISSDEPQGLRRLTGMLYRSEWLHGGGKVSFGLGALNVRPVPRLDSQLKELQRMATEETV